MVRQTIDSKLGEDRLAKLEAGFVKYEKQLPVPLVAKKTASRDLQNVPKSDGSTRLKENRTAIEAVKVSGTKRPQPECLMRSPSQQIPMNNNVPHLVYVRRKPESEQHKNSTFNKSNVQPTKQDEKNHEQTPTKDSTVCISKDVPESRTSPEGISSATPLITLDNAKSNITSPVADSACPQLNYPKRLSAHHWEERFFRLQNFLKVLDHSNQDDYRQMLRTLSSVDLSRLAVELEKRSIQLSLEEAKEVQRAKLLNVLDKHQMDSREQQPKK